MKRSLLIWLIIVLNALYTMAQQNPHYTQYMFNDFIINPAVAGTKNFYQIRSNHRFQWIGINDAPITNTLSVYGPHSKLDMGFGAFFYNDVTGPTSRSGLSGTYAYNVLLKDEIRLSMGLAMGVMQFRIDGTKLTAKDPTDLAIQSGVYSTYIPDATIGAYAYAENFYAGASITQLFNNSLNLFENKNGLNKLKSHFYLTAGYSQEVKSDYKLEPSVIIKGTSPKIIQIDFTARVVYKDHIWGGISFRAQDAMSIILGFIHEEQYYFGFAYDIGLTSLRSFHSGTHELMLGYKFNTTK